MPEHQTTENAAKERFWDQFIARARQSGVKENALRWHVRRAAVYLAPFPNKRLKPHPRRRGRLSGANGSIRRNRGLAVCADRRGYTEFAGDREVAGGGGDGLGVLAGFGADA